MLHGFLEIWLPGYEVNGWDVFVVDRKANQEYWITGKANNNSFMADISADGRYVAFESYASNLVSGDTNGKIDVYVHDIQKGSVSRASRTKSGGQSTGHCYSPSISADGRYVAFEAEAGDLVSYDTNGCSDIFVRDRIAGTTTRVSLSGGGGQGNGASYTSTISDDGRAVSFESDATNLVDGDTNACRDVFVRHWKVGSTQRVSVGVGSTQSNGESALACLSGDGDWAGFVSDADDLSWEIVVQSTCSSQRW